MKCKLCDSLILRVTTINESFCTGCTKCPSCGRAGAIIDARFGVMPCKKCKAKMAKEDEMMTSHYKSFRSKEEYWAIPFWKHMGFKAKPEEKAMEKEMKRRGLSYLDLQRARNSGKNARFNNKKLVDAALKGELQSEVKRLNDNRRERFVGKKSSTTFT